MYRCPQRKRNNTSCPGRIQFNDNGEVIKYVDHYHGDDKDYVEKKEMIENMKTLAVEEPDRLIDIFETVRSK